MNLADLTKVGGGGLTMATTETVQKLLVGGEWV